MPTPEEVCEYLDSLVTSKPETKEDVRHVLLQRKRENLIQGRGTLWKLQRTAIKLMARVDYGRISPRLVYASPSDKPLWDWYRHILSSAPWNGRPGRQNYFFVMDEFSGGVLGIVDIGSEVYSLGPRDKHIGWTSERKAEGSLRHVANVGTCVCVSPFGILTGGKFQIMATLSRDIMQMWERRYGDVLAAVVTTSLYGKSSIYNRLSEFEYLGTTAGYGAFHITTKGLRLLRRFIQESGETAIRGGVGGHYPGRQDILIKACQIVGYEFDKLTTYQPRGVYIALMGDGALEYLRGETGTFEPDERNQGEIRDWWLDRWYSMRWPKKKDEIAEFDPRIYEVDRQIELCADEATR